MGKYISFGKWNHYYKYPFLAIFFTLLYDIIKGVNYENIFRTIQIFGQSKINFSSHNYIHQIFNYLVLFIFSLIFHINKSYSYKEDSLNTSSSSDSSSRHSKITLIHNDLLNDSKDSNLVYIYTLTIFIFVLSEQFLFLYGGTIKDLDFWMFEIVIISYICHRMFKINVYNHQKLGLILNACSFIFKIGSIITSLFFDDTNREKPIIYVHYNIFTLGIICFFIYLIFISLRAYGHSKFKWFMDLKYIEPFKLLMIYGLIGTFLCFFISLISTFIKCKDKTKEIDFNDYICNLNNNLFIDDNSTELYLENYKLYFQKFSETSEVKDIVFEILLIIFLMPSYFSIKYFEILTIQYLTPVHASFVAPLYFLIQKLALGIFTLIVDHSFYKVSNNYGIFKFHFDISGDILSILFFLIYLEIIEVKCCNFNYNIKQKIIERSLKELNDIDNSLNKTSSFELDEDNPNKISFEYFNDLIKSNK